MEDELRMLQEAMVLKDRLRVLAELQASYHEELLARGFDASVAEQLMMDWSRHAYSMTFRALPEPAIDDELADLLGTTGPTQPAFGAQPARPSMGDPSSVPPGEAWLKLVEDLDDELEDAAADADEDAA